MPKSSNKTTSSHGASSNQNTNSEKPYSVSEGGWVSVNTGSSATRSGLEIQKGNTDSWVKKSS